jgi:flagellar motility protein MotE (MotC chaperone)
MSKRKPRLTPATAKALLAEGEYGDAKAKIENAMHTLDDIKNVLSGALFLRNGKLSTGTIEYAAFRVETLSLIFDLARQSFMKYAQGGITAYDAFLHDLGEEVGVTFARDLLSRLLSGDLFLPLQDMTDLLGLWALFENDTGAGETTIIACSDQKIVIELRNNPLRRAETERHAHCGFYSYYIRALLNQLYASRVRILEENIRGSQVEGYTVHEVKEVPDSMDNCVFIAEPVRENLNKALNLLNDAYTVYDGLGPEDDYSPCLITARAALVTAQMEAICMEAERAPRQLFKVYKDILLKDDYKRMDETYQRVSKPLHREAVSGGRVDKKKASELLRDVRRSVYALEYLPLSGDERARLKEIAYNHERIAIIGELAEQEGAITSEERKEIQKLLAQAVSKSLPEDAKQSRLVELLKKIGGKAWEVAQPVISDVLSAAIKQKYGLD